MIVPPTIPPLPPNIATTVLEIATGIISLFKKHKDEDANFHNKLKEIQEENNRAMEAALARIKTQQETRPLIQGEMFKREQELLNSVNTDVASRFDQLIDQKVKQTITNAEKCKQIETDLHSLSDIDIKLRKMLFNVST
ncbi:hypothetical protein TI05_05930 [Achromatium sp. WMS3]|nr:hypothetical protein TI05_05930 [Achromatium sp. WMS3]